MNQESRPRKDYAGLRSGRLVAVRSTGVKRGTNYIWECLCDCGVVKFIPAAYLARSTKPVLSCGCYAAERLRETHSLPPGEAHINHVYSDYKRTAERRGYQFNLSREEFKALLSLDCHYCGAIPVVQYTKTETITPALINGIDRINNTLGYDLSNCITCCKTCNRAKGVLSQEDYLAWIRKAFIWQNRPV